MNERLLNCASCGTLIEKDELETKPVPGTLFTDFGFSCTKCGAWTHCYFLSPILLEKARKLAKIDRRKPKFARHFAKFKVKFENLQKQLEGRNG